MKVRTAIAVLVVFLVSMFMAGWAWGGQGTWIPLGSNVWFKEVYTVDAACMVVQDRRGVAVSCVPRVLLPTVPGGGR